MRQTPARPDVLRFAGWAPHAAVLVGLYGLHSAWWALGLYHAAMIAFLCRPDGRDALRSLGRGFRVGQPALVVVVAALTGPAFLLAWPWIAPSSPPVRDVLAHVGLTGAAWWAFCIYYGAIHPGIEEAFWRGLIAPRAARPWTSDLQFAAYHVLVLARFVAWPAAALAGLLLAVTALTWRRIAASTGGLAIPWLSHLVGDVGFLVAVGILAAKV